MAKEFNQDGGQLRKYLKNQKEKAAKAFTIS